MDGIHEGSNGVLMYPYGGDCSVYTFPSQSVQDYPTGTDDGNFCDDLSGETTMTVELTVCLRPCAHPMV